MARLRAWAWVVMGLSCIGVESTARGEGPPAGWKLAWSDEFDGDAIDRTKWDFDLGDGFYDYGRNAWVSGWGNDERQTYTAEPRNVYVRDGALHIRSVKESLNGRGYTSARVKSRARDGSPLFARAYGRFEFRAKLPVGRGLWPALWLLPQDDAYGGWPRSGEIDVIEARGQEPDRVLGTIHYGAAWPANAHGGGEYRFPAGQSIAQFHDYALEWEPGEIRWYVDGRPYSTKRSWWTPRPGLTSKPAAEGDLVPWPAPFDRPFYVVMNLAVGGKFLGDPDHATPLPSELVVDHVRYYEKVGGLAAPGVRRPETLPWRK